MRRSYHLNLNTANELERAAYQILNKSANKKSLVCMALIYYAEKEPKKVTGLTPARVADLEKLLAAERTLEHEQITERVVDGNRRLSEQLDGMEERLMQKLEELAVQGVQIPQQPVPQPVPEPAVQKPGKSEVQAIIEEETILTEEELDREAQELDPVAMLFLGSL